MALVDSLLTAMVRANGDALVMHVGERPYVVSNDVTTDLSTHTLNLEAMTGMLEQLLSGEAQSSLQEFGAVEHRLPDRGDDRFTVVAARGGDDIWIEIRRRRRAPAVVIDEPVAAQPPPVAEARPAVEPPAAAAAPEVAAPEPVVEVVAAAVAAPEPVVEVVAAAVPEPPPIVEVVAAAVPEPPPVVDEPVAPVEPPGPVEPEPAVAEIHAPVMLETAADAVMAVSATELQASSPEEHATPSFMQPLPPQLDAPPAIEPAAEVTEAYSPPAIEPAAAADEEERYEMTMPAEVEAEVADVASAAEPQFVPMADVATAPERPPVLVDVAPEPEPAPMAEMAAEPEPAPMAEAVPEPEPAPMAEAVPEPEPEPAPAPVLVSEPEAVREPEPEPAPAVEPVREPEAARATPPAPPPPELPRAPVLPMTRTVRIEVPPRAPAAARHGAGVDRLLRIAAARGASSLFLTPDSPPYLRVDGDIRPIDSEPRQTRADVEAAIIETGPDNARELVGKAQAEWIVELEDVGRVRCSTFVDHHGPGVLFNLIATRAATAEQLGLAPEVEALATEAEGLVIVTGPRGSGKSTLMSALVDLVNRQRSEYVVTLERQIRLVHENRMALVSQREIRGGADEAVGAARAALRENPDVLVIDDLGSAQIVPLIIEAAGQGLLVMVSVTAPSTSDALARLVDLAPPESRKALQAGMAEAFRGAVSQVLLKKTGGGRVAAREVLLGTKAVTTLIAEGQFGQLPVALESGRRHGMTPLIDTLLACVQSGAVDIREAFRKTNDRDRLLAGLKRQGIDTSVVERLA